MPRTAFSRAERLKRRHRQRRRNSLVALIVAVVVLGTAGTALAFWTASATGNASALAGGLSAPTNFQATLPTTTTMHLSWTAPANVTSYTLSQSPGSIAGCSATPTSGTTSCDVTGLSPNAPYTWTLTAKDNNWLSTPAGAGATTTGTAPAITSFNNATFTVGSAGSFQAAASGVPAPTFSNVAFSGCAPSTLPSAVTFSSAGLLSGTPASGTAGSYTVCIDATNGVAPDAQQKFTLTVNAGDGLGAMTTPTSSVAASSTGNTITFTYTAASTMTNGAVSLQVPAGWTAPQTTTTSASGYTTSTLGTAAVTGTGPWTITVTGVNLTSGQTGTIVYGSTTGGGPGATATSATGAVTWQAQEKSTSGGTLTNITSPSITIMASTTQAFAKAGQHTLNVPAGVTSVNFTLNGAGGGGASNGAAGGAGGQVKGTITLASNTSGTNLTVVVGGGGGSDVTGGSSPSCIPGGSGGNGSLGDGGGGGGASCIYQVNTAPIAIAGGGGGGGTGGGGAGNGGASSNPNSSTSSGNGSGTQPGSVGVTTSHGSNPPGFTVTYSGGGAGSSGGATPGGTGMSSNTGGNGGASLVGGGGGGGGYASGGGAGESGTAGGGGGGGAGWSAGASGYAVNNVAVGTGSSGGNAGSSGTAGSATFTAANISSPLVFSALGAAMTWTNSSAKNVTVPSGTNNDLLFLVLENNRNIAPPTVAGWTQVANQQTSSPSAYAFTVWWKLAAGESSVSVTPGSGTTGATAWVIRYVRDGGFTTSPASATAAVQQNVANATTTLTPSPNVTTNQALATVISLAGIRAANTQSLSAPQSFAFETQNGSGSLALGVADQVVPTSGGTDTSPTWSQTGTAAQWAWATVAFF